MSIALTVVGVFLAFIGTTMILSAPFRRSALAVALIFGVGVACRVHEPTGPEPAQGAASPAHARSGPGTSAPAPAPIPGDDGGQQSPTQHWMGQARGASDTERQSDAASGSGDPDANSQP